MKAQAAARKRVNVFLNYSCQAKCAFCFNPAEPSADAWRGPSYAEVTREIFRARENGMAAVNFLGGEVTLRKDLERIFAFSKKCGMDPIQIDTNGLLLADRSRLKRWVASGLNSVRLSVHGASAKVHDEQVKVPGAFEKIVDAIANLRDFGIETGVNFVITRGNVGEVKDFAERFSKEFKITNFSFSCLRYIGHLEKESNFNEASLPMRDAVAASVEALEALDRGGLRERTTLSDCVPCLAPAWADRMVDWTSEGNDDLVMGNDGSVSDSVEVCHEGKRKLSACQGCRFETKCLGVERSYLDRFGDEEFRAV